MAKVDLISRFLSACLFAKGYKLSVQYLALAAFSLDQRPAKREPAMCCFNKA